MTMMDADRGTPAAAAPPPIAPPAPETEHNTSMDTLAIPQQQPKNLPDDQIIQQSWGKKVGLAVLSALGGANDISLERDPQSGKMVATAVKSGPGQQWKRIIASAITGFGAAEAGAGTGPGAMARGAGLGVQAGTQMAQQQYQQKRQEANEDFEVQQKAKTATAQNALLNHQITASTYNLGRAQVEAQFQDAERENQFASSVSAGGEGSTDLGIFPDFKSVVAATKTMPQLHDHQANGQIVGIPHVGADNKIDGMHYALVTPDWLAQKTTKDVKLYTIKAPEKPGDQPTVQAFTVPAGSITNDQYMKASMATTKTVTDQYNEGQKQKEEAAKQKDLDISTAAGATKDYATAEKERADAAVLSGMSGDAMVDMIGRGQMPIGRMAYLMARKPEVLKAVADKYPGFDGSKVDSYVAAYHDFTSTKPGSAGWTLVAGGTALSHLQNLMKLNTVKSHIPGTPDYNAYQNQLDTLAPELAKFYGDTTIPAIASIKKTLGATLPYNRDAAIKTQANSMGQRFDSYVQQWRNAAPSQVYEARMPGISDGALAALHNLVPEYSKTQLAALEGARAVVSQGGGQTQPPPAEAGQPIPRPAAATGTVMGSDKRMHWTDGKADLGVAQ